MGLLMPSNKIEIEILDDGVTKALSKLVNLMPKRAQAIIEAGGKMIEDRAKRNISRGTRSGKVYKATKSGKKHQASAPGEFPKTDTGQLARNITTEPTSGEIGVTVGSRNAAPHGYWLECGTTHIEPRPWLSPSAEQERDDINKLVDQTVDRLLNGL